jgi:adenine deaminase
MNRPISGPPRYGTSDDLKQQIAAAWGRTPAAVVVRGGRVLLPTDEFIRADIAIVRGRIVCVAPDLVASGSDEIDATGKFIVPGYIEPHAHIFGPLSVASYVGEAVCRGTAGIVADDSFLYSFLDADQHDLALDVSAQVPILLRWSLRADSRPRGYSLEQMLTKLNRKDVIQVGEILVRSDLSDPSDALLAVLSAARERELRIEGHIPGGSFTTIGAAAAAGVSGDHEAMRCEEVVNRLRSGMWAHLRHNGVLPDVPRLVPELLERRISLERTTLTVDWTLPPWIKDVGLIDAALAAAMSAGLPPAQAYASATRRAATYLGVDRHLGLLAPGRAATFNVLDDEASPTPRSVYIGGTEVAHNGRLSHPIADVDWKSVSPPRWSRRTRGPELENFLGADNLPAIFQQSSSMVREGTGPGGDALECIAIDPATESVTRATIYGWPGRLRALASTLTPLRILVAVGSDPRALHVCIDAIIRAGGGAAVMIESGLLVLPLSVGGAISSEPFSVINDFWTQADQALRSLGYQFGDPIASLLYLATESLPGARFTSAGLVETKTGRVIAAPRTALWPN